ncbi:MAG: aldehyde dehydrogenase family protein [Anaerolineae bacterium]
MKLFPSTNPYTGEVWAEFPAANEADVDRAVKAARAALDGPWGRCCPASERGLCAKLPMPVVEHAEYLGQVEVQDNGKLIREMSGQLNIWSITNITLRYCRR